MRFRERNKRKEAKNVDEKNRKRERREKE